MPYDDITYKHLTSLKEKIQQALSAKGLDDTGEASNSLEVQGQKLLGADYLYYLQYGRGPGRFPPIQNIVDWVRRKLGIEDKGQIAFLVGRKIANEGTEIYKDRSKGIEIDPLIEEMLEALMKEIPDQAVIEADTFLFKGQPTEKITIEA